MDFPEFVKIIIGGLITIAAGLVIYDRQETSRSKKKAREAIETSFKSFENRLDAFEIELIKLSRLREDQTTVKEDLKALHELLTEVRITIAGSNIRDSG